jgi:epoxyqueuosine reductase
MRLDRLEIRRLAEPVLTLVGQGICGTPRIRRLMRFIPPVRRRGWRRVAPPLGPWPDFDREVPAGLRGSPGIGRDLAAEQAAFEQAPVPLFEEVYRGPIELVRKHMWHALLPMSPRYMRAMAQVSAFNLGGRRASGYQEPRPGDVPGPAGPLREAAGKIGLSRIGVARYDERYAFAPNVGQGAWRSVIVCLLEQNYAATQTIPSAQGEKSAFGAYSVIMALAEQLAAQLRSQGWRSDVSTPHGRDLMLHYGVATGLGQLGLNGQLLTPQAGSRCRIVTIVTEALLEPDVPRDFGIPSICDQCQACVRRCPSGAITKNRKLHRGIEKAKINTKRCLPVVAQAHGCAVCMKVCPVQRYGLAAVYDHYEQAGEILGTGTDELEGYTWPEDGLFYPAGRTPRVPAAFFDHPELDELANFKA